MNATVVHVMTTALVRRGQLDTEEAEDFSQWLEQLRARGVVTPYAEDTRFRLTDQGAQYVA
jgi:hypothetical protein